MKNIRNFLIPAALVLFTLTFVFPVVGQSNPKINWVTIEEAEALNKTNPKKLFIDFYTDWCGWCKRLDETTFSHPIIVDYVNKNYYAVKFNAEGSNPVSFRGMEFANDGVGQRRSAHNFAVAVLQGRLGYPSMAFFDENLDLITTMSGYRPPEGLEPILVFFSEGIYKQTSDLDGYISNFKGTIK